MARVNVKQFIFACTCTLSVLSLIIFLIFKLLSPNTSDLSQQLESQSFIIDKVNVTATAYIKERTISIKLRLETYEFEEILNENILDIALLKQTDQLIEPVDWQIDSRSQYVLEGYLTAQLNSFSEKSDTISLELFFSKPLVISWTIN